MAQDECWLPPLELVSRPWPLLLLLLPRPLPGPLPPPDVEGREPRVVLVELVACETCQHGEVVYVGG